MRRLHLDIGPGTTERTVAFKSTLDREGLRNVLLSRFHWRVERQLESTNKIIRTIREEAHAHCQKETHLLCTLPFDVSLFSFYRLNAHKTLKILKQTFINCRQVSSIEQAMLIGDSEAILFRKMDDAATRTYGSLDVTPIYCCHMACGTLVRSRILFRFYRNEYTSYSIDNKI
jgi:hypothetical protein